jgi:zinc transport system substrate-binding protein
MYFFAPFCAFCGHYLRGLGLVVAALRCAFCGLLPFLISLLLCGTISLHAAAPRPLVVGTTLHPYFSFTTNVAGERATVVPLIAAGFNPHNYQPQPADLKRAMTLDALVLNGVGHDPYALEIVRAAGMEGKIKLIAANERVALLPISGLDTAEKVPNPHTFIGISAAIQQVYTIADGLAALDPAGADTYRANARAYAARLRRLKADAMAKIAALPRLDLRCAAVHGSYDYLLQEFGLQVALVIEPAAGMQPSAAGLKRSIDELKARKIQVLLAEEEFPAAYVETIRAATGVRTRFLKHLTAGEFTADNFEAGMRHNLEQLTAAIIEAHGK